MKVGRMWKKLEGTSYDGHKMGTYQTTALYLHRQGVTMLDKRKTIADRSPEVLQRLKRGCPTPGRKDLRRPLNC